LVNLRLLNMGRSWRWRKLCSGRRLCSISQSTAEQSPGPGLWAPSGAGEADGGGEGAGL